jgi:hypothetical protein
MNLFRVHLLSLARHKYPVTKYGQRDSAVYSYVLVLSGVAPVSQTLKSDTNAVVCNSMELYYGCCLRDVK